MRGLAIAIVLAAWPAAADDDVDDPLIRDAPAIRDDARKLLGLRPAALRARAPSGEPSFSLVNAYGVRTWTEACETRGDLRVHGDLDEIASYARAWCAGNRDAILGALGNLSGLSTPGLATAVRTDILALLADTRDAHAALAWLDARHLAVDDDLADVYLAAHQPSEAASVLGAELAFADDHARCLHYGRVAFGQRSKYAVQAREEVVQLARHGDDDCKEIAMYLGCPLVTGEPLSVEGIATDITACEPFESIVDVAAVIAYHSWPGFRAASSFDNWRTVWSIYTASLAALDTKWLRDPQVQMIALAAYDEVASVCKAKPTRSEVAAELLAPKDPKRPDAPLVHALEHAPAIMAACEAKFGHRAPNDVESTAPKHR